MPDVQLVCTAKIKQSIIATLACCAVCANAQLEGLEQTIPVQHMVMAGASTFQSAPASNVKQPEEKPTAAKSISTQVEKKTAKDTVLHAESEPAKPVHHLQFV